MLFSFSILLLASSNGAARTADGPPGSPEKLLSGTALGLGPDLPAIVEHDSDFSPAWANLGTLFRRNGLPYHAEAAYLEALEIDRLNSASR